MDLLTLINGVMIYCASFVEDGDGYTFSASKAVMAMPGQKGELNFVPIHDSAFRPTQCFVPYSAVIMAQDIGDAKALAQFKSAVSGIQVVNSVPKGLKLSK